LLHSDKGLVDIPSSIGSFGLVSYHSKLWETLSVVCIGHITFIPSWILQSRTWGCQTWFCPCKTMVNNLGTAGFLPCTPEYKVQTLVIPENCL
jgi:hypothetical protein